MRIAWITPFNVRSAIGRYSAMITAELHQRGYSVAVVRCESDPYEEPIYVSQCPIKTWNDVGPDELRTEFDVVVYNIGDHIGYHDGIFRYLDCVAGTGIFHDAYLYDLFSGWLVKNNLGDSEHDELVDRFHGGAAVLAARAYRQGRGSLANAARLHPMTPWIASRVQAALVHSEQFVDQLKTSCPGPVMAHHLVYSLDFEIPAVGAELDHVVISTFGHVNPNKCVDKVIRAIGSSRHLRECCEYRVVGEVEDHRRQELDRIATTVGFGRLVFLGRVDGATLSQELAKADIICCLRYPVLETGSASAIEAMLTGRPVVVADAGFYHELPEELVFKVDAAVSVSRLSEVLKRLVTDPKLRTTVGQKARAWARDHFSVDRYCDTLIRLLERSIEVAPLFQMTEAIGRTLAEIGVKPDDPSVTRIGAAIQALFAAGADRRGSNMAPEST